MNIDKKLDASETGKLAYAAPELVAFGDAKLMTRNVNEVGPGDAIFSVLRHS